MTTGHAPTTLRWDDPDGSWWLISWDSTTSSYNATKLTYGDDGEEYIVDDLGFGATRITSINDLAAEMHRILPDEMLDRVEQLVGEPAPIEPADSPDAPATHGDRPMGTRYRIDLDDGTWWELGWDKPLGTFFATRFAEDSAVGDSVLDDSGNQLSEIATIERLGEVIGRPVPGGIAQELAADATAHPFTSPPRFLPDAGMLVMTPDPSDGSAHQTELARWEARLRGQEARLEAWASSLTAQSTVEPVWELPAAPVVAALRNLQHDMAGEDDLPTFAARLGFDDKLVDALRADRLPDSLDVGQIGRVCEALRCSPYDLWGPDLARRIQHAYGPEHWPSHIEPLAEGRDVPAPHDEFIARRVEADVARIVGAALPAAASPTDADAVTRPPSVSTVCYRQEGLLAESRHGVIRYVESTSDAEPDVETYHFRFRQVTEPRDVLLYPATTIGEQAPASHDADPTLASIAESFRTLPWLPSVDLVRFVDDDGREEWLGWNPEAETWEAWDDPRSDYPGAPVDVLDAAGFTDPERERVQVTTDVTDSVEIDERQDPNVVLMVNDGGADVLEPSDTAHEPVPFADLDL